MLPGITNTVKLGTARAVKLGTACSADKPLHAVPGVPEHDDPCYGKLLHVKPICFFLKDPASIPS